MEKDWLYIKEFADSYGVHEDTIRRYIEMGDLRTLERASKHSRIRIPKSELERLLKEPPDTIAKDIAKERIKTVQPETNEKRPAQADEHTEEQLLTKEAREYDIKVFQKLDNIINDKDFWEYFYSLKAGHQKHSKKALKLDKYLYYTQFESSKHVHPMLRTLFDDFLKKFDDLERHIAPHSFTMEGNLDIIKVNPYVHRKYWSAQEVAEFTNKFLELVDIAEAAYVRYRAAVRDILYI